MPITTQKGENFERYVFSVWEVVGFKTAAQKCSFISQTPSIPSNLLRSKQANKQKSKNERLTCMEIIDEKRFGAESLLKTKVKKS